MIPGRCAEGKDAVLQEDHADGASASMLGKELGAQPGKIDPGMTYGMITTLSP
jgi:hypothetical protein